MLLCVLPSSDFDIFVNCQKKKSIYPIISASHASRMMPCGVFLFCLVTSSSAKRSLFVRCLPQRALQTAFVKREAQWKDDAFSSSKSNVEEQGFLENGKLGEWSESLLSQD